MKKLLIVSILLLFSSSSFAQGPPPEWGEGVSEERKERIKKRVETMRIWKLTEALALDEDRAIKFFPRYKEFMNKTETLKRETIKAGRIIEKGFKQDEKIDYSKQYNLIKSNMELMQKDLFKFVESNSDILNDKEKAALLVFEMRFEKALHGMMMDIWQEEGAPRRDGKRFPGGGGRKGP